jgi:2-polyprenyl-6-methoxyphenol hydroxylase-like FAD-dependent oxidoreductase
VGITLALLLARRGIRTVVLEQAREPQTLPRAHAVNPSPAGLVRPDGHVLSVAADDDGLAGFAEAIARSVPLAASRREATGHAVV